MKKKKKKKCPLFHSAKIRFVMFQSTFFDIPKEKNSFLVADGIRKSLIIV